jgi:hypothetical protein
MGTSAWVNLKGRANWNDGGSARFLTETIERMIRQSQRNRMFLANKAIIKYRELRKKVLLLRA